jgi:hypothetical protein
MLSELDIWDSAGTMIQRYGAEAGAEANRRMQALTTEGNIEAAETWRSILSAIETLLALPDRDQRTN